MTRYLGTWTLPSGNAADIYWREDGIEAQWDTPPSPDWSAEDVEHWRYVSFPAIVKAIEILTGKRILGVSL